MAMLDRISFRAFAMTAVLLLTMGTAAAFDDALYPNLAGQWRRLPTPGVGGQPGFDPSKPSGRAQGAPLTPEYQAIFEASVADQAAGGHGNQRGWSCRTSGMPIMMTLFEPMEIIVLPETTYIRIDQHNTQRRIFTDGRTWPDEIEPSYIGYSIGKWIDQDGDGRYDLLEVETRGFKGPRVLDATGLPMHADNQSVIKERIYVDKGNPNVLHDEITLIDHALTRPWTVTKNYRRDSNPRPVWIEWVCAEGNSHVAIGKESYYLSADGLLMPSRKDQAPPDLRYFKPATQR
jgi:hypothetical protein